MPELPEIETIKRSLTTQIVGGEVDCVIKRREGLRQAFPDLSHLKGRTIVGVDRRSKYLLINFEHGDLIIHLGMSGVLRLVDKDDEIGTHDHWEMKLTNGSILRLKDHRRFGVVLWQDKNHPHKALSNLGPEPLTSSFTSKYLYSITSNKKAAIKGVIMDASVVVGVGNIYASEALFLSKIHPLTPSKSLSLSHCKTLVSNIKIVLKKGIEAGGATFRDYRQVDGSKGSFVSFMQVYAREGQDCFVCKDKIQSISVAGRSSAFCPSCQPIIKSDKQKQ